jgi:zinc protease
MKEAKAVVEKYFGGWKAEGPKPETDLPAVPANKPSAVSVPDASRVQSEVTLAETVGLTRKDPAYYTMQVGVHVLAGGFYSTRLYRDLREKTGLVYAVEAALEAGMTRSLFVVEYASDPGNVAKARAIIERDLKEMQTTTVDRAELRRAKSLLIHQLALSGSSTDGVASMLLDLALKDLPLDEPMKAAKDYRKTTARQVRKAFTKWVRPEDLVEVTLSPAPR